MILKALFSQFLSGGIFVACLACAYYFLRFWQKTRDSLFAVFSAFFLILAVERVFLLATVNLQDLQGTHELRGYVYWIRFSAFMMIIIAFALKNRRSS